MKKAFIFSLIAIACMAFTGSSLPEKIKNHYSYKWVKFDVTQTDWESKKLTKPVNKLPRNIENILQDSFLTSSDAIIFVHVSNFLNAAKDYNTSRVEVGYGFMPDSYGSPSSVIDNFREDVKNLISKKVLGTRLGRWAVYSKAMPTYTSAFFQKSDTLQGVDLFLIWKGLQYCQFVTKNGISTEIQRSKKPTFTYEDWRGKEDFDGKIYAFIFRRLNENTGFTVQNAVYYGEHIFTEFFVSASPSAKKVFETLKEDWLQNKITTTPRFQIN